METAREAKYNEFGEIISLPQWEFPILLQEPAFLPNQSDSSDHLYERKGAF